MKKNIKRNSAIPIKPGNLKLDNNINNESSKTDEQKTVPLSSSILEKEYDNYTKASISAKSFGQIKSFGYNTYKGLFKNINEDKVSVSSQVKKPVNSKIKVWPKISYFGLFDGHGGETCSEFFKKNFLLYLTENKNFPLEMKTCITETIIKVEEEFFKQYCSSTLEDSDLSGSCALICIIFDNKIYIANVGDSRAIISLNKGTKVRQLTVDHKPKDPKEYERAIKNGSKIYIDNSDEVDRDINKLDCIKDKSEFEKYKNDKDVVFREYPSDLAVMRTVGDIKAKKKEFGGIPGSIINTPDIFMLDINSTNDFIIMGCDGIFDDMSNEEVVNAAWYIYKNKAKDKNYNIHELSGDACDIIIKYGMEKETTDNLSCIIIGLEGLEKFLKDKSTKDKVNISFKKSANKGSV